MDKLIFFWHRRDLRLNDNAGLYHALKESHPVLPVFIFDKNILEKLEDKEDARVTFIHNELSRMHNELAKLGSTLLIKYGRPEEVWKDLIEEYDINSVFTNRDYEPYAKERDENVHKLLSKHNVEFHTYKDHVIFEEKEVVKDDGTPYTVFTPYSRKWKSKLNSRSTGNSKNKSSFYLSSYPSEKYFDNFYQTKKSKIPRLSDIDFKKSKSDFPTKEVNNGLIRHYQEARNFPARDGTSRLGVHFRFGTISIRAKARKSITLSETFLNELIWRDFYAMILANFPHVVDGPFREKYKHIDWRNNEQEFEAWCQGKTGYPMVDAGMRELTSTGFMHNRVRMVVASFLTKHLLIDWRWGEAWFARKLLDFELASNNGGWQWAAGCGTDAAPYFRIFNPESQQKKFDKELKYIKKWIPEYGTSEYPDPIVEHKVARERCLSVYKEALDRAAL